MCKNRIDYASQSRAEVYKPFINAFSTYPTLEVIHDGNKKNVTITSTTELFLREKRKVLAAASLFEECEGKIKTTVMAAWFMSCSCFKLNILFFYRKINGRYD